MKHLAPYQYQLLDKLNDGCLVWHYAAGDWFLGATDRTFTSQDVLQLISMGYIETKTVETCTPTHIKLVITDKGRKMLNEGKAK